MCNIFKNQRKKKKEKKNPQVASHFAIYFIFWPIVGQLIFIRSICLIGLWHLSLSWNTKNKVLLRRQHEYIDLKTKLPKTKLTKSITHFDVSYRIHHNSHGHRDVSSVPATSAAQRQSTTWKTPSTISAQQRKQRILTQPCSTDLNSHTYTNGPSVGVFFWNWL